MRVIRAVILGTVTGVHQNLFDRQCVFLQETEKASSFPFSSKSALGATPPAQPLPTEPELAMDLPRACLKVSSNANRDLGPREGSDSGRGSLGVDSVLNMQ